MLLCDQHFLFLQLECFRKLYQKDPTKGWGANPLGTALPVEGSVGSESMCGSSSAPDVLGGLGQATHLLCASVSLIVSKDNTALLGE